MRNEKGFTLIEIVMVIVLLGILAAVAIPRFLDLQTEAKTAAAKGVKGALRGAFSIAYAKHRVAGLTASETPTAGADYKYITDCATAVSYLEGGAWPDNTSCAAGVITLPDATTVTITAETNTSAATF